MEIITWIANNFFGTPAILLGFIVLLGLLLQKKNLSQVISGTFKAIIGFLIINAGAAVITGSLGILNQCGKKYSDLKHRHLQAF